MGERKSFEGDHYELGVVGAFGGWFRADGICRGRRELHRVGTKYANVGTPIGRLKKRRSLVNFEQDDFPCHSVFG